MKQYARSPAQNGTTKGVRLLLWLSISVGFALLPLAANYMNGRISGKPPSLVDLLAGGELFLISAALTADGIGRALLGGERRKGFRISCGIGCTLLLASTSVYFGRVAYAIEEQRTALTSAIQAKNLAKAQDAMDRPGVDRAVISGDSMALFGLALVASFGVILVDED